MAPLCLSPKIPFAIIRLEERSDGSVAVEREKSATLPVKPRRCSVASRDLLHVTSGRTIAQSLRSQQILLLAQPAKFATVLGEMLVQMLPRTKSDLRSHRVVRTLPLPSGCIYRSSPGHGPRVGATPAHRDTHQYR